MILKIIYVALVCIVVIGFASSFNSQEKDYSLARAYQVDGKYIYLYSIPYHDHDTVMILSTMVMTSHPDKATKAVLKKALRKAEQQNIQFDGIITGAAQFDYVIKFN